MEQERTDIEHIDPELAQLLEVCSHDTRMTALTFFPERFYAEFDENIHGEIFKLIDGTARKVAIAAPRGFGKTSIVALALIARYIIFRLTEFVVYINMSHDAAGLQTENLRRELMTNRSIKSIFGPIKSRSLTADEFEETFSKKAWVAYDTLVWPRGSGQQVRGVLFRNSRPGLIVIDDLEDPDTITSDDIRKKRKEWLYADVIKAIPRLNKNWKIVYIDTLKHEDSLLQHLLTQADWASCRLEACDDNFNPTAPKFMSKSDIAQEWEDHQKAGQTDVFYRELRNLPISTRDAAFQADYYRYYNLPATRTLREGKDLAITDASLQANQEIENVIIVDPAKTVKMHSAESAVLGWGLDLGKARMYIRDAVSERFYPDELYDAIFNMAVRLSAVAIGIEETSLNEFIKQPIKNLMFKKRLFFTLVWLKPRGQAKKEERIKHLVPYYRLGYIYHNASCPDITKLEGQYAMFPRSKLWDLMDCAAYIIEMMELGERYFFTAGSDDPEDEFKDINYEPPIKNWRVA